MLTDILGKAKNVTIKNFNNHIEYNEWAQTNPQYIVYDIRFITEYNTTTLYVIYREVNNPL